MKMLYAALIAALVLAGGTGAADQPSQKKVLLTSKDGALSISGTLLGFDGEFYRIRTAHGNLTVDGEGVTCKGSGCPDRENFIARMTISGSRTMGDVLLPALVEAFAVQEGMKLRRVVRSDRDFDYVLRRSGDGREVARLAFRLSNTEQGLSDLLAGKADMAMALREIRSEENDVAKKTGLGDLSIARRARVIGLDGLVLVVSPRNPVEGLSFETLAGIFAGRIANWQEVGGPDAPIAVHTRGPESGLTQGFQDKVMRGYGLVLSDKTIVHESSEDLVDAVARDPFAIGLASYSEVGNAKVLSLTGECGFAIRPSILTLKSEDYPLATPLFLYMPRYRFPEVGRDFLRFLGSHTAQLVIRRAGFVDQQPLEISIGSQGERLANAITAAGKETKLADLKELVAELKPARRLSVTFRFQAGSTLLDAQSRANVVLLSHLLKAGQYHDKTIIFAGFTDGEGTAETNRLVSERRANAVHDAVLKMVDGIQEQQLKFRIKAFGETLPIACDTEAWGRRINRRVEVWLR